MKQNTNKAEVAPARAGGKMTLIEGNEITTRAAWSYRGMKIWRKYRTFDPRNKTHRGFDWWLEMPDGSIRATIRPTRKKIKELADNITDGLVVG